MFTPLYLSEDVTGFVTPDCEVAAWGRRACWCCRWALRSAPRGGRPDARCGSTAHWPAGGAPRRRAALFSTAQRSPWRDRKNAPPLRDAAGTAQRAASGSRCREDTAGTSGPVRVRGLAARRLPRTPRRMRPTAGPAGLGQPGAGRGIGGADAAYEEVPFPRLRPSSRRLASRATQGQALVRFLFIEAVAATGDEVLLRVEQPHP